jgi:hypothetical protein
MHGKLWYHDNDVVSYRAREIMKRIGYQDDADWTRNLSLQLASLGYTSTRQQSRWMYQRGFGFALCHGMFPSWFDLHGGYFDGPELMAEVRRLGAVARRCEALDRSSCSQILVVTDEEACALAVPKSPLLRRTLLDPQNELIRIGAPVDHILLGDLQQLDVSRYRLVIFLNCWRFDQKQRRWMRRRLMNGARHLLWCGGAGWFDEQGGCRENARELTGFRHIRVDDAEQPFTLEDNQFEQPFAADSGAARDVVRRKQPGWTSVWSPTAALPARVYRELAQSAGAHIFNGRDDAFYLNRSLLCLHANGDGPRELRFPQPVNLVDLCQDRLVASQTNQWLTTLKRGESAILQMDPSLCIGN